MDGTSDQAASNWGNVYIPGDPNNPPLTRVELRSRPPHQHHGHLRRSTSCKGTSATASLFYSGQSGRPYTLTFSGSRGRQRRQPGGQRHPVTCRRRAMPLTYTNGTYQDLLQASSTPSTARRAAIGHDHAAQRLPRALDEHAGRPLRGQACRPARSSAEITLDMLNMINLFSSTTGLRQFRRSFQQTLGSFTAPTVDRPAQLHGHQPGDDQLAERSSATSRDDLRSRWQLQLGAQGEILGS